MMKMDPKQQNRENAAHLLEAACVPFTYHNGGAHLVVEGPESYIDFWPGTGKWIIRSNHEHGFGVRDLIRYATR